MPRPPRLGNRCCLGQPGWQTVMPRMPAGCQWRWGNPGRWCAESTSVKSRVPTRGICTQPRGLRMARQLPGLKIQKKLISNLACSTDTGIMLKNCTLHDTNTVCSSAWICSQYEHIIMFAGFLRSGKVREFWGSQGKSGKTERVKEKSGNFKILLTRPIIYALFSQFLSASVCPCKHRRLVYIAIFYNGTKFSITFVYLVLFY